MWTLNGKKVRALATCANGVTNIPYTNTLNEQVNKGGNSPIIRGVANSVSYYGSYDITGIPTSNQSNYAFYYQIYLGQDDIPETGDEYTLANPIALPWYKVPTITLMPNGTTVEIAYYFTNDTGAPVTIKEIGLCARVGASTTVVYNCLLNRKVLASPVTMNVGDNYTFTFTIDTSNLTE